MAKVIRRHWVSDVGAGLARRDRLSCDYEAYVPDMLADRPIVLSSQTAADVADAERAIAVLDAEAATLADTEALARILLRAESVASSRIEGLEVGARRLLRAEAAIELGAETSDVTATEVLSNINAMAAAIRRDQPRRADNAGSAARLPPAAACGHAARCARGSNPRRAELDRRQQLQPVLRGVRPSAAGVRARSPRRPVPVLQYRRHPGRCSGRHRARAVRDHPPVRRRQRADGPGADPPRSAPARAGHARAAAGVARAGDLGRRLRARAGRDPVSGSGRLSGCTRRDRPVGGAIRGSLQPGCPRRGEL